MNVADVTRFISRLLGSIFSSRQLKRHIFHQAKFEIQFCRINLNFPLSTFGFILTGLCAIKRKNIVYCDNRNLLNTNFGIYGGNDNGANNLKHKSHNSGDPTFSKEEDQILPSSITLNEAEALTHQTLLRQSSCVAVDAAMTLLHRSLRAFLDTSREYKKQLHVCLDLLEFCITVVDDSVQHDAAYNQLIATRSEMNNCHQQLKDLLMLIDYAKHTLENAAMAAFITDSEFSAVAAQQLIQLIENELVSKKREASLLETQLCETQVRHATKLDESHKNEHINGKAKSDKS